MSNGFRGLKLEKQLSPSCPTNALERQVSLSEASSPTNASFYDSPGGGAGSSPFFAAFGSLPSSSRGLPRRECDESRSVIGELRSPSKEVQDDGIIIFDWDDTLCPTWWITRVMAVGLGHIELEERGAMDPKMCTVLKAKKDLALPDSKYRAQLSAHSRCVEMLLRTARTLGQVKIVTLGSQPWFEHSAVFFYGLDIPALLTELGITVYFATMPGYVPTGMNTKVAAKRMVMAEALVTHYGSGLVRWHAFSIGDQPEESEALKLCCRDCPHRWRRRPLCKTLTLTAEPLVEDLTQSLERLTPALRRLVVHDRDVDWTLSSALEFK